LRPGQVRDPEMQAPGLLLPLTRALQEPPREGRDGVLHRAAPSTTACRRCGSPDRSAARSRCAERHEEVCGKRDRPLLPLRPGTVHRQVRCASAKRSRSRPSRPFAARCRTKSLNAFATAARRPPGLPQGKCSGLSPHVATAAIAAGAGCSGCAQLCRIVRRPRRPDARSGPGLRRPAPRRSRPCHRRPGQPAAGRRPWQITEQPRMTMAASLVSAAICVSWECCAFDTTFGSPLYATLPAAAVAGYEFA